MRTLLLSSLLLKCHIYQYSLILSNCINKKYNDKYLKTIWFPSHRYRAVEGSLTQQGSLNLNKFNSLSWYIRPGVRTPRGVFIEISLFLPSQCDCAIILMAASSSLGSVYRRAPCKCVHWGVQGILNVLYSWPVSDRFLCLSADYWGTKSPS